MSPASTSGASLPPTDEPPSYESLTNFDGYLDPSLRPPDLQPPPSWAPPSPRAQSLEPRVELSQRVRKHGHKDALEAETVHQVIEDIQVAAAMGETAEDAEHYAPTPEPAGNDAGMELPSSFKTVQNAKVSKRRTQKQPRKRAKCCSNCGGHLDPDDPMQHQSKEGDGSKRKGEKAKDEKGEDLEHKYGKVKDERGNWINIWETYQLPAWCQLTPTSDEAWAEFDRIQAARRMMF